MGAATQRGRPPLLKRLESIGFSEPSREDRRMRRISPLAWLLMLGVGLAGWAVAGAQQYPAQPPQPVQPVGYPPPVPAPAPVPAVNDRPARAPAAPVPAPTPVMPAMPGTAAP